MYGYGQIGGAGQTEPATVDAGEAAQGVVLAPETPLEEVVEIAETPGDEAEAGDAEQGVEDLGVDLDPDAARGVEVVAVFDAVKAFRVAHIFAAAADQQQEEHAAPGDDVEAVDGDQEAERGDEEFPEAFEADEGCFAPGVFRGEFVAVGVDSFGVGVDSFGVWVDSFGVGALGWRRGGRSRGSCGFFRCDG